MSPPIGSARTTGPRPHSYEPACDAAPTVPAAASEPDYQRVFAANSRPPELGRFVEARLQGQAPVAQPLRAGPSGNPVATKLDDLERRYAGAYRVPGRDQPMPARPTFHSAHAANVQLKDDRKLFAEARRMCGPALHGALQACAGGRPTPEQLVRVTQALIDAGGLAGVSSINSQAIRDLQQRYHLGIDCIGYVSECQRALHGSKFDRATERNLFVQQLRTNGLYQERHGVAAVVMARPGDVLHLSASPRTEGREHNVVIRQHDTLTPGDPRWASLSAGGQRLMAGGGPVHLLDVVQSGGGSDDVRGIRHQTWLFDEKSKLWGMVEPGTTQVVLFEHGPQEHAQGSLFSPKSSPR